MPLGGAGAATIGIVLMLMFGKKRKKGAGEPERGCPPFEWDADRIDGAIAAGIEAQICNPAELTANLGSLLYPKKPDGTAVAWPKQPPYAPPAGDEQVACLWNDLEDRVREILDDLPDDACPEKTPADVIGPLISRPGAPKPGTFYRISQTDGRTLTKIAKDIFNLNAGNPLTEKVIRCITSSGWNLTYYGTPYDPDNKLFPKYTSVKTDDGPMVLAKGFLPRHQDAISEMFSGREPDRTIDDTKKGNKLPGAPAGTSSYGTLWIPQMRVVQGSLVCPDGNWEDGRPKTEPPPEVLEVLD